MDVQHASKSGTLASPLRVAIEVPMDENLDARIQKLGGMHERRTIKNEQAMPALGLLPAVGGSRSEGIRLGGQMMPVRESCGLAYITAQGEGSAIIIKCLRILKNFKRQAMGDEQEGSAIMSKCLRILKSFKRQALGDEQVMPALGPLSSIMINTCLRILEQRINRKQIEQIIGWRLRESDLVLGEYMLPVRDTCELACNTSLDGSSIMINTCLRILEKRINRELIEQIIGWRIRESYLVNDGAARSDDLDSAAGYAGAAAMSVGDDDGDDAARSDHLGSTAGSADDDEARNKQETSKIKPSNQATTKKLLRAPTCNLLNSPAEPPPHYPTQPPLHPSSSSTEPARYHTQQQGASS